MSLGLERGVVRLVPPDPAWPALFAAEAARLRAALGPGLPLALEHMGSTAVPGLAAKPILDLLGGVPPGADVAPYVAALVRAGYAHRGPSGIPGREFFRRGEPRAYHLHVTEHGGPFWRRHLAFRDALRADPAVRDAYAALKLELAGRHPRDREAYIDGKGAFVRRVVAAALADDASGASALRVRLAQPADASVLAALLGDYLRESFPGHAGMAAAALERDVLGDPSRGLRVLLAESRGTPVGFAAWHRVYDLHWGVAGAEVVDLYVRPGHRGLGVALALVAAVCAGARREELAYLRGTSFARDSPAGRFYERVAVARDSAECHCGGRAFRRLAELDGRPPREIVRHLPPAAWNHEP